MRRYDCLPVVFRLSSQSLHGVALSSGMALDVTNVSSLVRSMGTTSLCCVAAGVESINQRSSAFVCKRANQPCPAPQPRLAEVGLKTQGNRVVVVETNISAYVNSCVC